MKKLYTQSRAPYKCEYHPNKGQDCKSFKDPHGIEHKGITIPIYKAGLSQILIQEQTTKDLQDDCHWWHDYHFDLW